MWVWSYKNRPNKSSCRHIGCNNCRWHANGSESSIVIWNGSGHNELRHNVDDERWKNELFDVIISSFVVLSLLEFIDVSSVISLQLLFIIWFDSFKPLSRK